MRRTLTTRLGAVALLLALGAQALAQPPAASPVEGEEEGDDDAGAGAPRAMRVVPLVDAATAVATGRGVSVSAEEVYAWLRDSAPIAQQRYAADPALLREIVDRLVADRLLAQEARRRGLERDPVVRAAAERALVARLRALVLNPRAGDASAVTDDDTRRWYDAHPERFHIPERRRVRVVFSVDRIAAQDVLRLAQLRRRGRVVNEFRRLAAQHNDDPELAGVRGELRDVLAPAAPGGDAVDLAVRAAAYEVREEGAVVPRVVPGRWRGREGFYVVRYIDRRAPIERTYAESAEWIRVRIVLERRVAAERAEVDRLEREAGVRRVPLVEVVRVEPDPTPPDGGTTR